MEKLKILFPPNINLYWNFSKSVGNLLNDDPYETLGEHIQTRFEDNYKFHRYTNTYGNAFGENYYQISITCRSVLTDPEIYQQLLTSHLNNYGRYYGYWYGQDLASYDPQTKASETNALVESSLAGSWLCFASLIAGLILMLVNFTRKHYLLHTFIKIDLIFFKKKK